MEDFMEVIGEFAEMFGEQAEADEPRRFTIDNDVKADWAIRKIAEEQAEYQRLTGCCDDVIQQYQQRKAEYAERFAKRTDGLRAMLWSYFASVPTKDTKTQKKYELPSGALILKKASSDFKADTYKLREWLEKGGMADYLKTEVSPKWGLVKKQLVANGDGTITFSETGEIVPADCVAIEPKDERFEVKPL